MSRSRVEFTTKEMHHMVRKLTLADERSMMPLRDQLAKKVLKLSTDSTLLRSIDVSGVRVALRSRERNLMATIIYGISLISRIPEGSIAPSSRLVNLRLSSAHKRDQLRVYINQYVRDQEGTVYISTRNMDGFKSVQDIFDFAITLIP